MGDALVARYWCHMCSQMVSPVMEVEIKCPFCESGFVEEMDGRRDQETELGSDRSLSLWAPILLGMMGGGHRRRRLRRESESEEEEEEEEESPTGELARERDLETIIRRRRRSSAAVLQLLQGLRAGLVPGQQANSESDREREQDQEQERVILVNPFNQAIILQGSFDVNQNQNQNQNRAITGSLGDYLIGSGLDLLLQHLSENDPNRYGSPPAKKEAVESMPTVKIEENLQCSVCLDEFEIGTEAKEMPCKHKFHGGCIMPWLELHSSCPVCRFQMPAEEVAKVDGDGSRNGSNRVENNDGEGGNGNGRRAWLSIPWPFNGLFSPSNSGGTSSAQPSPPQSSSLSAASQRTRQADEN